LSIFESECVCECVCSRQTQIHYVPFPHFPHILNPHETGTAWLRYLIRSHQMYTDNLLFNKSFEFSNIGSFRRLTFSKKETTAEIATENK